MSVVDDVRSLLDEMSERDRAAILEIVSRGVGGEFPGIEVTPGVCGGAARIVRTRIPVWVLAQARRQGLSDADILRAYPTLRQEDIAFAAAYCHLHGDEIERQILENDAA